MTAADTGDRLALVWADGGCTGSLVEYCLATLALFQGVLRPGRRPECPPQA